MTSTHVWGVSMDISCWGWNYNVMEKNGSPPPNFNNCTFCISLLCNNRASAISIFFPDAIKELWKLPAIRAIIQVVILCDKSWTARKLINAHDSALSAVRAKYFKVFLLFLNLLELAKSKYYLCKTWGLFRCWEKKVFSLVNHFTAHTEDPPHHSFALEARAENEENIETEQIVTL